MFAEETFENLILNQMDLSGKNRKILIFTTKIINKENWEVNEYMFCGEVDLTFTYVLLIYLDSRIEIYSLYWQYIAILYVQEDFNHHIY